VAHRDDLEAARHRIDALERELAETKARAEREVADARARAEQEARAARASERSPSTVARTSEDRSWAASSERRFRAGAAIAAGVLDLPIVVLLAGWRWDLDDADSAILGWTLLPTAVLLLPLYLLARRTRAPFPGSVVPSGLLAGGTGWFAMHAAAGDMVWGDVLAEPPWRWLTRGSCGLLAVGFHALIVSQWCAEAALSDAGSGD
jgi:hypothetical protein